MAWLGFDPETGPDGLQRPRRTRLVLSYVPDYVVLVAMAVLWGVISLVHPFEREFSLTDKTIQYPHKPDSVPFYAAVLLSFVLPAVVVVAWTFFIRRSFHDMNSGFLGLCIALVLNMMITNTIKNLAGRLRPDFIARCDLDPAQAHEPAVGLLTVAVCRQTDLKLLRDGMRSFPSGHTSFSFAGLGYLSLWLAGHAHIGDRRGHAYKSFMVMVPLLAAALIAVSRTKDYRHHWQDVLAGTILGLSMAAFGYRLYYPWPLTTSEDPSRPYRSRISGDDDDDVLPMVADPFKRTGHNAAAEIPVPYGGSIPAGSAQQPTVAHSLPIDAASLHSQPRGPYARADSHMQSRESLAR
ncbi:hypothetical protein H4R18_003317 [Coemansia javaensis]|uniref:Phosphatidic acid phosphatase type 2/haloperoxidase domain-containing protein n=1 Tax=Coemansia javaensis TaxID=2761396 RepID=A0A9W8HE51_9FUNG|nr:hypothetical protein H4R18_003317 [Coemansia javaensis]